jgi:hypothetical protein
VCQAIVREGLNDLCYLTQVTAAGIAQNPQLVADMDRANFRLIFVGFESMEPAALKQMRKPTSPAINQKAAALLRQHRMAIIAGGIVGYPDDTRESVKQQFRQIWGLKPDVLYMQILTPYPQTALRQELLEAGLIANLDDYRSYNGFNGNIRTKYLDCRALETLKCNLAFWGGDQDFSWAGELPYQKPHLSLSQSSGQGGRPLLLLSPDFQTGSPPIEYLAGTAGNSRSSGRQAGPGRQRTSSTWLP